jgi:SAM-dependent methyltransferase
VTREHWPRYYAVTVDRPAWRTVVRAIELFEAEGGPGGPDDGPAGASKAEARPGRFAVDLGCGAGRDARELLRHGWRVLAIDGEPSAVEALRAATPAEDLPRLETLVADLAEVAVPSADLVNASISLPFVSGPAFDAVVDGALAAVRPGGRFATMLFGDRDESATDAEMSCRPAAWVRARLAASGLEVEDWFEREEDGQTALGDPHHWHILEVVARRPVGAEQAGHATEGSIE